MTREQFANQVLDLVAKRFPLVKIARGKEPFSMLVNGHVASLENVYRMTVLRPEDAKHHVERWVVELIRASEGSPDQSGSLDELRSRIMPMITPDTGRWNREPIHQPLIDGLAVAYALDSDRTISYLTPERLDDWHITVDDLHEIALYNLSQRSQALAAQAAQDADERVYLILFQSMDGYDASRLLLPNLHEKICEHLGTPFAAAIPNRDILLCFRNDADTVDKLLPQIQEDYERMPHHIFNRILLVTPDGIAPRL